MHLRYWLNVFHYFKNLMIKSEISMTGQSLPKRVESRTSGVFQIGLLLFFSPRKKSHDPYASGPA